MKTSHLAAVAAVVGLAAGGLVAFEFGPQISQRAPSSVSLWSRPSSAELIRQALAARKDMLGQFYQARGFAPAWTDDRGLTQAGAAAFQLVSDAPKEGLASYAPKPLPARAHESDRVTFDMALSDAMLRYAHDLRLGQVDANAVYGRKSADLPKHSFDLIPAVAKLSQSGDAQGFLAAAEPGGPDYQHLKAALARYRAIAAAGGWPQLDAHAPRALVARRLAAEGYHADPKAPRAALIAYQTRNGLKPSGSLDAATLAKLNVPVQSRVAQIAANMERWRWLPSELGGRHIMVNLADFSLAFVDGDAEPLVSRVVVGERDKQTPLLETKAVSVTINPEWHVPTSIVKTELEPKMAQDAGYLASKNMRITKDGQIVQDPGPDNSLGQIKLELTDKEDIYLHDTPAKSIFRLDDRARSHGCVRVEKIRDLATQALGIDEATLQGYIDEGGTNHHPLKTPIPVYIAYWTALADAQGVAGFRADVYQRDAVLIDALRNKGSIAES
jgi:murein L,D-transpeptidase YcbB/YkuD